MNFINVIWAERNLGCVTGHAFRISGTTELLRRDVPPDMVRVAGRWASDRFLRYWRKHTEVYASTHPERRRIGSTLLAFTA
jgi:hypothetical protein